MVYTAHINFSTNYSCDLQDSALVQSRGSSESSVALGVVVVLKASLGGRELEKYSFYAWRMGRNAYIGGRWVGSALVYPFGTHFLSQNASTSDVLWRDLGRKVVAWLMAVIRWGKGKACWAD